MSDFSRARLAAARLRRGMPPGCPLAIVLGSGFRDVASRIKAATEIAYAKIPGFPGVGVSGHAGKVVAGWLGGTPVIALCGRAHYYEGHSLAGVTFPMRVLAQLGIKSVLLTNAAGGINRRFRAGDFMCLSDHINWMGANPLLGALEPGQNPFVDLSAAYDLELRQWLKRAAHRAKVRLREGVYVAVAGPSYETPAEIRAFARLGADAVGMSTVPETIVARQCSLRVAGLSCITNLAAGCGCGRLSHEDVLNTGQRVGRQAAQLIEEFARLYAENA
jgi:purine-nucleoside phosphorylase